MKGLPPNIPISLLIPEYEDGPVLKPPNPNIQGAMYSPAEIEDDEAEPGKNLTKLNYKREIEKRALGLTGVPFGSPPGAQPRSEGLGPLDESDFETHSFGGPSSIDSEESWPPGNIERRDTGKTINNPAKTEPDSFLNSLDTDKLTRTREPRAIEAMSTETKELLKLSEALSRSGHRAQANVVYTLTKMAGMGDLVNAAIGAGEAFLNKVKEVSAMGTNWGDGDDDEVELPRFVAWFQPWIQGKIQGIGNKTEGWARVDLVLIASKLTEIIADDPDHQEEFMNLVKPSLNDFSAKMAAIVTANQPAQPKRSRSGRSAAGGGGFAYPASDCVKQIQGILGVTVDGKFGPNTKAAWAAKTSAVALPATCALALAALQQGDSGATGGSVAGTEVDTQLLIKYLAYPNSLVHRAAQLVPTYQAASLTVLEKGALSCEDAAKVVASSMRSSVEKAFGEDVGANARLVDTLSIMPLCSPEDIAGSGKTTEQEGNLVLYQGPIRSPVASNESMHSIGLAKRQVDGDGDGEPDYEDLVPVFIHGSQILPIEMRPSVYPGHKPYLTAREQRALASNDGTGIGGRFLGIPLPGEKARSARNRRRELKDMRQAIRQQRRARR